MTRALLVAGMAAIGLMLFVDAGTLSLRPADASTGRARGCYSWLEDAIGVREPSDILRETQFIAGGTMMLGGSILAVVSKRSRAGRPNGMSSSREPKSH